jgi:hypothetical protein
MDRPHAAYPTAKRVVERNFNLIGQTEVCRKNSMACRVVHGSKSMHSMRSVGPNNNVQLQVRNYSCFCQACVHGTLGPCPNTEYAAPWRLVNLQPVGATEAIQEEEDLV